MSKIDELNVKLEQSKEQYERQQEYYNKQKEELDKEFEKQVKKLFKGIKVYTFIDYKGFKIKTKKTNTLLLEYKYDSFSFSDIDSDIAWKIKDLYDEYYGTPKEIYKINFSPYTTNAIYVRENCYK